MFLFDSGNQPKDWHAENDLNCFSIGVYGQCRSFPNPPDSGRELLEVDIEDPSDNGADDPSPAAVEYIATDLNLGVTDTTGSP